ncbi:FUSC family protein [Streptomyces sp. NPDC089919]|uniref:FUSC family protein n=1 Tax=Streptomyces sp. NPDC089919 TaxID=3155188 RepID=UPI003436082C
MSSVDTPGPTRSERIRTIVAAEGPAAARILVTAVVGWQVTLWLGADQPPVYAAIVPLVALRGDPMNALVVSFQRVLGVFAGVLLGIAVLHLVRPSTAALALVLAAGLALGMIVRAGGLNLQVAVSSLLVFANPSPDAYGFHRLWETAVGGVVTVVLAPLLWPPHPRRVLTRLAYDCRTRLTAALDDCVAVLGTGPVAARENLTVTTEHCAVVRAHAARARETARLLRFNPLRRHHGREVAELTQAVERAGRLAEHVLILAREITGFAGREGLAPLLAETGTRLSEIAVPTAEAIRQSLSGGDPGPASATVRAALLDYVHTDARPAVVVLRRPFVRIIDELGDHAPDG